MDILVAAALLILSVALFVQKPIKVELTHKHVLEQPEQQEVLKDPNEIDKTAKEVEQSMNTVIQNLNAIMNGREIDDGRG